MSTTFYVGEQPSDPLVITVRDSAGAPLSLTDVSSVSLIGDDLPDGSLDVSDAAAGKVQYTFDAPFDSPGVLQLQVSMQDQAGGLDYSAPFTITVASPATADSLIVTPSQVEIWTGVPVSLNDIARAQGDIMLVVGRDLTNSAWLSSLAYTDQFWLRMAVAQEAAERAQAPVSGAITASTVPGAVSVTNGDVSVTFAEAAVTGSLNGPALGIRAVSAIKKLTWMRPTRTLYATPFLSDYPFPPYEGWIANGHADLPTMWH
jgi:hypothetical protein